MMENIARTEKQLGAILRRARKQQQLTQGSLGEKIHLRQGTISRLEAGQPAVQLRTLMEALSALKLEIVVRPRSEARAAEILDIFQTGSSSSCRINFQVRSWNRCGQPSKLEL